AALAGTQRQAGAQQQGGGGAAGHGDTPEGRGDASTGAPGRTTAPARAHAAATARAYDRTGMAAAIDRGQCQARACGPAWRRTSSVPCAAARPLFPTSIPRGDDMDKVSNLPMALWKANLDLQARLGRLMQEGGQAAAGRGEGKAAAEAAVQAQERFVAGLGEALQEWQRQLARAWTEAGIDAGIASATAGSWEALLSSMDQAIAAMQSAGSRGGARKRGG